MTADDVDGVLVTPIIREAIRRSDAGEGTQMYGHYTGSSVRHMLAVLLDLGWRPPAEATAKQKVRS